MHGILNAIGHRSIRLGLEADYHTTTVRLIGDMFGGWFTRTMSLRLLTRPKRSG